MNVLEIGPIALKKGILTALLLSFANAAQAGMNLNVTYNSEDNTTTFIGTGSWDYYTATSTSTDGPGNPYFIEPGMEGVMMLSGGGFSFGPHSAFAQVDVQMDDIPSGTHGSSSDAPGQSWGLTLDGFLVAPIAYVAGESISSLHTEIGDTWGLQASGNINGAYVSGNGPTLNEFTFTGTVIPEPTTYATFIAVMALGVATLRRKQN
jgi:hypothetical protein